MFVSGKIPRGWTTANKTLPKPGKLTDNPTM